MCDLDLKGLQEFNIEVTAKNYDDFAVEVTVLAHNEEEARIKACAQEPRWLNEDPFVLMVEVGEESTVFCTYESEEAALAHVKRIRGGRWYLVHRDTGEAGVGVVIQSWRDT